MAAAEIAFEPFTVSLDIAVRSCRREDLAALEWFGMFAEHRDIIRAAFERHQRGDAIMLIAEANKVACGQVWIDLDRQYVDSTGVLWAIRVFPCLQNLGIGTKLIEAAEYILRSRNVKFVEMTVEKSNVGALRLYQRLGYFVAGELHAVNRHAYLNHAPSLLSVEQLVIRKDLSSPQASQ
jgi:ribosomal protein S18 acetylase RimI-like enzyme